MPHNGGRTQIVLNFIQNGRAFPFINALKAAQRWDLVDNSGPPAPSSLNSDGYPISISNGGVKTTFSIPYTERPGNWRLRWIGTGRLSVSGLGTTASTTDGDFTFDPGTGSPVLQIIAGTNITHVEMYHADDHSRVLAGEVFNAQFLETLAYGGWGVIRMLDWQDGNKSNVVKWAHRKPVTYAFYAGDELRGSIYGGTTTNSGDDYSVAAPSDWGGLVHGAIVTVKFNATASGDTPTLNVGSTGAKTIKMQDVRDSILVH